MGWELLRQGNGLGMERHGDGLGMIEVMDGFGSDRFGGDGLIRWWIRMLTKKTCRLLSLINWMYLATTFGWVCQYVWRT